MRHEHNGNINYNAWNHVMKDSCPPLKWWLQLFRALRCYTLFFVSSRYITSTIQFRINHSCYYKSTIILRDFFQGAHLIFFWFTSMRPKFFQAATQGVAWILQNWKWQWQWQHAPEVVTTVWAFLAKNWPWWPWMRCIDAHNFQGVHWKPIANLFVLVCSCSILIIFFENFFLKSEKNDQDWTKPKKNKHDCNGFPVYSLHKFNVV